MAGTTVMEMELKYVFPSRRGLLQCQDLFVGRGKILSGFAVADTEAESLGIHAAYYDTEDDFLTKRRMSLRLRREGERCLYCLKSAGTVNGAFSRREEWEWEAEKPLDAPDKLDAALLRAALSRLRDAATEEQQPVLDSILEELERKEMRLCCEMRFTRLRRLLVRSDSEAVLEMALDQGQFLRADGAPMDFAEFELELKRGSEADLQAAAREIEKNLALQPQPLSKFRRAYLFASEGHG